MRREFRLRVEEQFKAESSMILAKVDTAKEVLGYPLTKNFRTSLCEV
jgi:hypothetical protein